MTPLATGNQRTIPYVMGHPVHLVAIIRVVMTYHMVVNHGTMLGITSLQIPCTLFIPIPGMTLSVFMTMNLYGGVHKIGSQGQHKGIERF
jgi:hypothetical protein